MSDQRNEVFELLFNDPKRVLLVVEIVSDLCQPNEAFLSVLRVASMLGLSECSFHSLYDGLLYPQDFTELD
jgi:hypothetical protein